MAGSGADGGSDAYVATVEELVAALRQDPVNVQVVRGNGHTAEVDAQLTEIVASSEVPLYVALVGDLPGLAADDPAGDLAVRLETRLDPEAVYVVGVGDGSVSWSYFGTDQDLESTIYDGLRPTYPDWDDEDAPRPSDAGEAAIIAAVVAAPDHTVPDDVVATYTESQTWTAQRYESTPEPYLVADVTAASVLSGLFVALVVWRLARTWALRAVVPVPPLRGKDAARAAARPPARKPSGSRSAPDLEDVRRDATRTLDALTEELTERPHGHGVDDALGCRVAAEGLVASDDLLDVVGALVLARSGRQLLDRPHEPYRPCFLNPLHGRGHLEGELAVGRARTAVTLPVCRRCSEALARAKEPDTLLVRPSAWLPLPRRPYYEGGTVWARTGFGALDPELWRRVTEERS